MLAVAYCYQISTALMKIKSITKDHQYQPCDTPFERQTNVIPSKMQHLAVQAC